ncbi:SDR family NAD(P)-dependent oxidoreductase [Rhodococcus sp. ARC_M6]|uniref:SDR family NAD(P)-dependent oxidoreductase n=1 Tax=Rhodococcus sp. ARC_M6 TaxID=2928852 RepID=UPI001FB2650F|nr:SDR family oxidoreductase [Rhodococcus sp. ARC_M6]MCJ0906894.1 SDR family oxidoreductase [Rhodococcus sp. ARC_M6]
MNIVHIINNSISAKAATDRKMEIMSQKLPLEGRVALVTGAGRGVGAGIAMSLASAGAQVIVNDLYQERAESVAESITAAGFSGTAYAFDVMGPDLVESAVSNIAKDFGGIDILVHNAGIIEGGGRPKKLADMPVEDWQLQIELNLVAMIRLVQLVIPLQIDRGWGRLIQISSGASSRGLSIGVSAYGAAKAGTESLIRHIGVEYGAEGITANALALGLMEGIHQNQDSGVQKLIKNIPVGRLGRPSDVGAAAVWLCSEGGGFVNSQVIHLNGGTVFGR